MPESPEKQAKQKPEERFAIAEQIATAEGAGDLATAKRLKAKLLTADYAARATSADARRRLAELTANRS